MPFEHLDPVDCSFDRAGVPVGGQSGGHRVVADSILNVARLNCLVDSVELMVSEIVTNAYRHSTTETYVSMEHTPDDFRVTVWDHGQGTPTPRAPTDSDEHGRGLGIVEACADEWGVRTYPYGKAVWFSVAPKEEA